MKHEEVLKALSRIKNGTYCRVHYNSEMSVKAEHKKQGIRLFKEVTTTFRTGVQYTHMAEVIAERNAPDYVAPKPRANNSEWLIENKALHNTNTDSYMAYFIPTKNSNTVVTYHLVVDGEITDSDTLTDAMKAYLIDSALKPSAGSRVRTIKFDNIISIHQGGNI